MAKYKDLSKLTTAELWTLLNPRQRKFLELYFEAIEKGKKVKKEELFLKAGYTPTSARYGHTMPKLLSSPVIRELINRLQPAPVIEKIHEKAIEGNLGFAKLFMKLIENAYKSYEIRDILQEKVGEEGIKAVLETIHAKALEGKSAKWAELFLQVYLGPDFFKGQKNTKEDWKLIIANLEEADVQEVDTQKLEGKQNKKLPQASVRE